MEMSSVKSNANEYFLFSSQNKLKTKRQYYETVLLWSLTHNRISRSTTGFTIWVQLK